MADDQRYDKEESERRFLAALRGARTAGHKDREKMKLGKYKAKPSKSLSKRKAVKKS